jgi:hypothetical protein
MNDAAIQAPWFGPSIIIGAAQVVAALGADQLAVVAGEAVGAGGADLAVVDRTAGLMGRGVGGRLTMREIHLKFRGKIGVQGVRAMREHAGQISMEMRQFPEQNAAGA